MQQRLLHRGVVEIAGLKPEEEVRRERHDGRDRAKEFRALGRQQEMERWNRRQRDHGIERRQQPPHAPLVEARKGEIAGLEFRQDDAGDQIARYHEENVDADKAAEHCGCFEMESDHRQHGDGPQPVDVLAIAEGQSPCFVSLVRGNDLIQSARHRDAWYPETRCHSSSQTTPRFRVERPGTAPG